MSEENPNQDQPAEPETSGAAEDEPTMEDAPVEEQAVAEVTEEGSAPSEEESRLLTDEAATSEPEPAPVAVEDEAAIADASSEEQPAAEITEDEPEPPGADSRALTDEAATSEPDSVPTEDEPATSETAAAEEETPSSEPDPSPPPVAPKAEADDSGDAEAIPEAKPEQKPPSPKQPAIKESSHAAATHEVAIELKRIEREVRELLLERDPKRKRKLGGTARWHELEDDVRNMRFTGRMDEETLAHLDQLVARRHYFFRQLHYLASTRPVWNS